MINKLILDISHYFEYLRAQGYCVTFHNIYIPLRNYMDILTPYNISSNPFCLMVKSNQQAWSHCIERQSKVITACENGPFCGLCYAGMGEFIYPIKDPSGKTLAFISVGGYRINEEDGKKRAARAAQKYHLPITDLISAYYENLTNTLPDKAELGTLIMPLCRMFEFLNLLLTDLNLSDTMNATQGRVLSQAVVYIRRNYARHISVDEIAQVCHCSSSTLSHLFKRELGIGIREYIRQLRMTDAKQMLSNTDLPISTISDMLGYSNPNYFCHIFTQCFGQPPTKYRHRERQSE